MTREEAIEIQKWLGNNHFLFASTFEDVKASTNIAIKSLEAWEKVKEEIKNAKPVYPDRVKIWGTDTIIGIIDKHLAEVSE